MENRVWAESPTDVSEQRAEAGREGRPGKLSPRPTAGVPCGCRTWGSNTKLSRWRSRRLRFGDDRAGGMRGVPTACPAGGIWDTAGLGQHLWEDRATCRVAGKQPGGRAGIGDESIPDHYPLSSGREDGWRDRRLSGWKRDETRVTGHGRSGIHEQGEGLDAESVLLSDFPRFSLFFYLRTKFFYGSISIGNPP